MWESVEYCKQVTACILHIKMSSKLQHCCKYVFFFKCLNPNDNKKHSPVKKTARGDSYRLLIAHWVQKTRGMLPSHSLSLHVGFYSSSLVSQCCLYWSFVHWTWTFLRGAVKTKPDVNTIGVICMAAAPSYITPTRSGTGVATRAPCRWLPCPARSPVRRGCGK